MSFKKDDESGSGIVFQDKTTVLQQSRTFNESPISPRKCRILLTKIIYLLYSGETFNETEATSLFFGVTKLFQHKDPSLRQIVYLAIKELSPLSQDILMATSSIMKDIQPNLDVIYRPNAIRALGRVIDPPMLISLERFFKTAIVDRNPSISSAALVTAYHLFPDAKDVVKRWSNEAQEALKPPSATRTFSSSSITQYHALGVLYSIRQGDRNAVTKLIQQLAVNQRGYTTASLRNANAVVMLIRYASKIMREDPNSRNAMFDLIDSYLKHKSDVVNLEAARAITTYAHGVTTSELSRAVSVLQSFLTHSKPILKFSAMRTLSQLSQTHPHAVQSCNLDIEKLINDENRSVATFAITTLLKTGNEASVDRLMKQISVFMSEISDEFKVIVVNAIRSLCLKFPSKQGTMLHFLSSILRDEGGYDFKRAVVEAIFDMIKHIGDAKEAALAQLCEFIEDCEFTKLSVRILHLLGVEGPKAPQPHRYIRYIYNRVILENAIVRAAAVSSLARFGIYVEDVNVKKSVRTLLKRCLEDVDDEVRDRAAFNLKLLAEEPLATVYVRDTTTFSLDDLESRLVEYMADPEALSTPFDTSVVEKVAKEDVFTGKVIPDAVDVAAGKNDSAGASSGDLIADVAVTSGVDLSDIPEFETYGPVLKSSILAALTESEMEYVVTSVKHVFSEHVVFEFRIRNTVDSVHLENVSVIMTPSDDGILTEDFIIPIPSLPPSSEDVVYVSFTKKTDYPLLSFANTLRFISKEVDPDTGKPEAEGYDDEYQIEDVELSSGDYIIPSYVAFQAEWDKLRDSYANIVETFSLTALDSLKSACDSLIDLLSMEPLGGSQDPDENSPVHTLTLAGKVVNAQAPTLVLVRCRMTYQRESGVTVELAVRAESQEAAELVINTIA